MQNRRQRVVGKKRTKADIDPMVAEMLDVIAERMEDQFVPKPSRSALLDKAARFFVDGWLEEHEQHRPEIEEVKIKYTSRAVASVARTGEQPTLVVAQKAR